MKIFKTLIAMILSFVMILSFAPPVMADVPNGDNGPDSNGLVTELEGRIATLEATIAALMAAMNAAPAVDHSAISRQRQEAVELERFMFHMTYFGVTLTIAHNDFLIRQRDLTERQLELEHARLELGFSIQNNVDDLDAMLNSLTRQIELNNITTQAQRQHVETRRGRDGYEFIGNFRIPTPSASSRVRSLDELRTNLLRYNTSLIVLESHINQARRHNAHWDEIRLMEEQRDLLRRQLEMAALNSWSTYTVARAEFNLAVSERPLLESRLNMIDELFYLGEISEVDKMTMRFAIYAEQHRADMVAIALAMSIAELNYMMRGIIGG
ncbi:MAG: TolC family protein [Defluviitaleaceae bacterium]|nr:TolC family protein [Defluviitaleaceae bacterium]